MEIAGFFDVKRGKTTSISKLSELIALQRKKMYIFHIDFLTVKPKNVQVK